MKIKREFLTVSEVSDLLNIHPNTVRRWAQLGLLKAWRVGPRRDRRFQRTDVLNLLSEHSDSYVENHSFVADDG